MNDEQFEEIKKILLEIKQIISAVKKTEKAEEIEEISEDEEDKFFKANSQKKPSDNVYLIFAWFYSQYGSVPISKKLIQQKASKVGLIIPNEPDATLRSAGKNTKPRFRKVEKGYQLTVHGEIYLKEIFKVDKGTKEFPKELEE